MLRGVLLLESNIGGISLVRGVIRAGQSYRASVVSLLQLGSHSPCWDLHRLRLTFELDFDFEPDPGVVGTVSLFIC